MVVEFKEIGKDVKRTDACHVAVPPLNVMPPSSTATTVFWPIGIRKGGLCYGWVNPAICVAGVLDVRFHVLNIVPDLHVFTGT